MAPNYLSPRPRDRALGNFSAGPACLSDWVMRTAQEEFTNKNSTGMGIMEVSFTIFPLSVIPTQLF